MRKRSGKTKAISRGRREHEEEKWKNESNFKRPKRIPNPKN